MWQNVTLFIRKNIKSFYNPNIFFSIHQEEANYTLQAPVPIIQIAVHDYDLNILCDKTTEVKEKQFKNFDKIWQDFIERKQNKLPWIDYFLQYPSRRKNPYPSIKRSDYSNQI